jgi:hypothetical protein
MFRERDYPISIPTWEEDKWIEDTVFNTQEEFIEYLKSLFKEPGQYEFDESVKYWQQEGLVFRERGYYCAAPVRTRDFIIPIVLFLRRDRLLLLTFIVLSL